MCSRTRTTRVIALLATETPDGSGFWLIHSVPKYPDFETNSYYYSGSDIYGQSFLCISLAGGDGSIDTVAEVLRYNGPYIYSTDNVAAVGSTGLSALVANSFLGGAVVRSITADSSVAAAAAAKKSKAAANAAVINASVVSEAAVLEQAGQGTAGKEEAAAAATFTVFGKSASWASDLYANLVEPTLQLPFRWETWRRSGASYVVYVRVRACVCAGGARASM
jgi:hypothetical protein